MYIAQVIKSIVNQFEVVTQAEAKRKTGFEEEWAKRMENFRQKCMLLEESLRQRHHLELEHLQRTRLDACIIIHSN